MGCRNRRLLNSPLDNLLHANTLVAAPSHCSHSFTVSGVVQLMITPFSTGSHTAINSVIATSALLAIHRVPSERRGMAFCSMNHRKSAAAMRLLSSTKL